MRLTDYSFVFDGWRLYDDRIIKTGFNLAVHTGLPYVEFIVVTDEGAVSVRCDPCSLDQDQGAYAAMVRTDLEQAMAKQKRSQPPESDAPARLARHLKERRAVLVQRDRNIFVFVNSRSEVRAVANLIHEVAGSEPSEQSPDDKANPVTDIADSF